MEAGQTLRQVVLTSLQHELDNRGQVREPQASYWANRKLVPEFEQLEKADGFKPAPEDRDVTDLISDDRDI